MRKLFILIFISILFVACEQNEGKGGTSSIKGLVMVQEYNKDLTIKLGDPYPTQDVDVYLIYGDNEIYGDRFQTGGDGKYEFKYLQSGTYTVYALSKSLGDDDENITSQKEIVSIKVDITGKNQTVEVETINIID